MTNEEIEALSKESIDLISRKAKDYEESKRNLARVREIHNIINEETLHRLAENHRAAGIDPHAPCPTCGHIPIKRKL